MSNVDHWNDRYAAGTLPWDTGTPDLHLVARLGAAPPGLRVLDVGCGTGTNAVWLAERGHRVTALELAPLAAEKARARAAAAGVSVEVVVADFLTVALPSGPFDFVYDRGVFHVFDDAPDRERFAAQVARHLVVGGQWLSVAGSTEGGPRESGPPRRSACDVVSAIEPSLEIVELGATRFSEEDNEVGRSAAWRIVAAKRAVAPVAGTVRPRG